MTTRLVTPWWVDRSSVRAAGSASGATASTALLDWETAPIRDLVRELDAADPRLTLRRAHEVVAARVRPVYAVDDQQPASRTLRRGRGSCSQRFALLESVARAVGVATRARGLLVDGSFWYPRFPHLRFLVPAGVVLAWPEFQLEDHWVSVSALFSRDASSGEPQRFTNADGETLFDAVRRAAVSWDGSADDSGNCWTCDLSAHVRQDFGYFDSRDDLFKRVGQTLHWTARTLADPILSRWAPDT